MSLASMFGTSSGLAVLLVEVFLDELAEDFLDLLLESGLGLCLLLLEVFVSAWFDCLSAFFELKFFLENIRKTRMN